MKNLSDIKTITSLLKKHHFKFSHSLGQNFITNCEICPKMAALSGANKNTNVIEIGPGIGVLTTELAKIAKKVLAIEIDTRLIPILHDTLSEFDNVEILNADVMKLDLKSIIEKKFNNEEVVVCANLPYYITTPIIMKLLESKLKIKAITVMVQKEVAERLCAGPGTRNASAIGVAINYYSEPTYLFGVDKTSFEPSPKVDSAVIKLDVKSRPSISVRSEGAFFKVIRAAFLKRRKNILNSISTGFNIPKDKLSDFLKTANIPSTARAENLTLEQFALLSDTIFKEGIIHDEKN